MVQRGDSKKAKFFQDMITLKIEMAKSAKMTTKPTIFATGMILRCIRIATRNIMRIQKMTLLSKLMGNKLKFTIRKLRKFK